MWSFLTRPRERKLAHWAMACLAGTRLLLQVLGLLAQTFAWPDERPLMGPSEPRVPRLRLHPRWDPVRSDPRFQALLVKYADPRPVR